MLLRARWARGLRSMPRATSTPPRPTAEARRNTSRTRSRSSELVLAPACLGEHFDVGGVFQAEDVANLGRFCAQEGIGLLLESHGRGNGGKPFGARRANVVHAKLEIEILGLDRQR